MKRLILGALALVVAASTAGAQRLTDPERRELERKLEALREEVREIERQLGRTGVTRLEGGLSGMPFALALETGRPRLGVVVKTEPDAATDSIGAVLQAVTPKGPAEAAGLQSGDIVVRFKGEQLAARGATGGNPGERLIELARTLKEGDTVQVQYRRGRDTRTASVAPRKLDDLAYGYSYVLPEAESLRVHVRDLTDRMRTRIVTPRAQVRPDVWVDAFMGSMRWSDMELTTLDGDLGRYFGTTEGLLVVRAPRDSLLSLKSGDVILRIGGRVPSSSSHAVRILRSYEPGDQIRIELMRDKRRTEVSSTVPQRERGLHWEEH